MKIRSTFGKAQRFRRLPSPSNPSKALRSTKPLTSSITRIIRVTPCSTAAKRTSLTSSSMLVTTPRTTRSPASSKTTSLASAAMPWIHFGIEATVRRCILGFSCEILVLEPLQENSEKNKDFPIDFFRPSLEGRRGIRQYGRARVPQGRASIGGAGAWNCSG